MNNFIMVFSSFPTSDIANKIAKTLVQEKLAACVNILPGVQSIFFWENELNEANESLILIKTKSSNYEELEKRILELHPYACPEVIGVNLEAGSSKFLNWIEQVTK